MDVRRREDQLLDKISEQKTRILNALVILEEAIIAHPDDALLGRIWRALR